MYTIEKKAALSRALKSQKVVVEESIRTLKDLQETLDKTFTIDDLPKRAKFQRVLGNLHYERELISSFIDELGK